MLIERSGSTEHGSQTRASEASEGLQGQPANPSFSGSVYKEFGAAGAVSQKLKTIDKSRKRLAISEIFIPCRQLLLTV